MKQQTSILIIHTGGTIGMAVDKDSGSLHPVSGRELYEVIPLLNRFNCHIDMKSFSPLLDSSDMNPKHWVELAERIEENYEAYDGFVVLHGSDTMAFTASALSFMLENLNKPVIFTGSQLPLGMLRTDGRENLVTSIEIAASREDDTPVVPEVAICFENRLLRGNRTFKYNVEHFNAFHSGNYPPLAEVGVHVKFNHNYILKPNFKKLKVHTELDNNIQILKLFPGISGKAVTATLSIPGLKGIILETYGTGNAMSDSWFLDMLKEAVHKGIVIFSVTQCKAGSVEMGKYKTSVELDRIGVISGHDITTESALAKMMYLFGSGYSHDEIKELLTTSIRGEMTTAN
jgi:L-asparaginase